MSFAQIFFLLGGIGVIGPILAHLLARPRYRRIPFTMLQFLQIVKRDVQSKRRMRNLLLLLIRCLIIVVLAMLFAGPRLIKEARRQKSTYSYFLGIDNSISMSYRDRSGTYWDKAVSAAVEFIGAAPKDSVFNVCSLSTGTWARDLSAESALAYIPKIKILPRGAAFEDFLSEIRAAGRREADNRKTRAVIISDFTPQVLSGLANVSEPARVDDFRQIRIASEDAVTNSAIVGAQVFGASASSLVFSVTAASCGGRGADSRIVAGIGDRIVATVPIAIPANDTRSVPVEIPIDASAADTCLPIEFAIETEDGLSADNKYYFAVTLPKRGQTDVVLCGSDAREVFLMKTALEALSSAGAFEKVNIREVYYSGFEPACLKTANVALFAGVPPVMTQVVGAVDAFVRSGGRAVFFVSKESSPAAMEQLFAKGVLPALPRQLRQEATAIDPTGPANDTIPGVGPTEIAAFRNYAPEKILLTGFYECEAAADAVISSFLKNSNGFLFVRQHASGVSILVNTSADDSLGMLTKSPAAMAFTRILLGRGAKPVANNFACGEALTLACVAEEEKSAAANRPVWLMTPSGGSIEPAVAKSMLVARCPDETGFVSTLSKPVRYAAVNLPDGETDMTVPAEQSLAMLVAKIFRPEETQAEPVSTADVEKEYAPVWRYFAWAALVLILFEAFVANRSQR